MHEEHMSTALNTAAALGQRVAVFAGTGAAARELFDDFGLRVPAGYEVESRRTNGMESYRFKDSGGEIRFYSLLGSGYRGWSCDRLFVPVGISGGVQAAVVPLLATSRVRVLTGY